MHRFYSYTAPVSSNSCLRPDLRTSIPGPRSRELAQRLAAVESPNVTCLEPEAPVFWERARASNVWDVDGNRFVDLDAAFGVASVGHGHPRVVEAIARQSESLLHGMGDVHPTEIRTALLERLVALYPGGGPARGVLSSSGSDAVEAALKTALLATGRPGVVAFEGAYHGLSLGALDATFRADFREPFLPKLSGHTVFARFGDVEDVARAASVAPVPVGAVLVEPVQGRGGIRLSPPGFLAQLRELCDANDWLLIADEVYTGFGRTGRMFACEHDGVVPDLLCLGKALAGGMPLSACVGTEKTMKSWPASRGESLLTQTYLGHPAGCAAAHATLEIIEQEKLVAASARNGAQVLEGLRRKLARVDAVREVRGLGLMLGVECRDFEIAERAWIRCLGRGVITLPAGDDGRVLSMTPALGIGGEGFEEALEIVCESLQ